MIRRIELIGRRGFARGFDGGGFEQLLLEAIDAALSIDQLLLTREEGMAGGANFQPDVPLVRGTGFEAAPASASDFYGVIGGVNSSFHDFSETRITHKQNARRGDQPATGVFCYNKARFIAQGGTDSTPTRGTVASPLIEA